MISSAQARRMHPVLLERARDQVARSGLAELARRHVHRDVLDASPSSRQRPSAAHARRASTGRALDEAGLLGEGDEMRRRDHAVLGMEPAQQRLGADDPARAQVELRLVVEHELLRARSPRAGRARAEAALRLGRSCAPRRTLPGAPRCLRAIHRRVGALQQGLGVCRRPGTGRCRRSREERAGRRRANAATGPDHVARRPAARRCVQVRQDHRELVAAQARHRVGLAHAARAGASPPARADWSPTRGRNCRSRS